jgi:hypothetical protein
MKLLFLIASIIVFILTAILCFIGGSFSTFLHIAALLSIGLACFVASFLPLRS